MDDIALLRDYAARKSDAAFEVLVSRYVNLVYSSALRQTRDPHSAEEVTQAVFLILARKAGRIREATVLTGWLFKTTRFVAMAQKRASARRQRHEIRMQTEIQETPTDTACEQISPMLDEALARLGEKDRQAVLLRFFGNKSLAEVGASLGTNEDTARKRVTRALEKLRKIFAKRGVVSTAAIIAGTISAHSAHAASAGLAAAIAVTAAKGSAVAASIMALVKGTLKMMIWLKAKTAIAVGASVLLAGCAVLSIAEQEQNNRTQEQLIRAEEEQIRGQERQGDLTPEQRKQLADRMNQLRARQNQLRETQNQSREQDPNPFARRSAQVSPFTAVRYDREKVTVNYAGVEYQFDAINDLATADILEFCRRRYRDAWQKRFAEDLVVVLNEMQHPINADRTVSLTLVDLKTGEKKRVERTSMTEENRWAILAARQQ